MPAKIELIAGIRWEKNGDTALPVSRPIFGE
jgi:hypothetical protein